jgi:hypothetical protein
MNWQRIPQAVIMRVRNNDDSSGRELKEDIKLLVCSIDSGQGWGTKKVLVEYDSVCEDVHWPELAA